MGTNEVEVNIPKLLEKLGEEICDFHVERCSKAFMKKYKDPDEAYTHMEMELCSKCPVCRNL